MSQDLDVLDDEDKLEHFWSEEEWEQIQVYDLWDSTLEHLLDEKEHSDHDEGSMIWSLELSDSASLSNFGSLEHCKNCNNQMTVTVVSRIK